MTDPLPRTKPKGPRIFGLGIQDRSRRLGLLKQIDYLSTVSGGGYIGAWLVAGCGSEPGWMDPPDAKEDRGTESFNYLREYSPS